MPLLQVRAAARSQLAKLQQRGLASYFTTTYNSSQKHSLFHGEATRQNTHATTRKSHVDPYFPPSSSSFSTTTTTSRTTRKRIIVVGAGSAGCVITNRVSADPGHEVVLLEAGPPDTRWYDSWLLEMPSAMGMNLTSDYFNWDYRTAPQQHLDGRTLYYPRGRVVGGSSSINAMVYLRGNREDYNRWAFEDGATGWSYNEVLPYFKRMETYGGGANEFRGGDGPLQVTRPTFTNPLFPAFVKAGVEAGFPDCPDINGRDQEGFGVFDASIWNGTRNSASRAFLRPALERSVTLETNTMVKRLLFQGSRAIGVEFIRNGQVEKIYGDEIVLCAGAIGSPTILQLSGVGDAEHLTTLGIDSKLHLPDVGRNLQDHLEVYVQYRCKQPVGLFPYQWKFPHNMINVGLEWFTRRSGVCATNHLEAGAFFRSDPDDVSKAGSYPNIQLHFLPAAIGDCGATMHPAGHAYQVHMGPMRPTSRGSLQIQSKDPTMPPHIDPNFLSTEFDRKEFRQAIRVTREVFKQPAFAPFCGGELEPGVDVVSDSDIDAFVRQRAESAHHVSGTCRMGTSTGVVGADGRVHGLSGLRVADASIMPSIVSANLNCPSMMIGEKMSDAILGIDPLPPCGPIIRSVYQP